MPSCSRGMRGALRASALALSLLLPEAGYAGEWTDGARLNWDTGEGKSYLIPALEVAGFVVGLNAFNRTVIDSDTYGSDGNTIWRNLRTAPVFDTDPFGINQVGHPYQGSYYYGFARSAGRRYWESLGYSLLRSLLWGTAREATKPSLKHYVNTTIRGSLLGQGPVPRCSLLLQGRGAT